MKLNKIDPKDLNNLRKSIPSRSNEPSKETKEIRQALASLKEGEGLSYKLTTKWKKTEKGSRYNSEYSKLQSQIQWANNQDLDGNRYIIYLTEGRREACIEIVKKGNWEKHIKKTSTGKIRFDTIGYRKSK